MAPKNKVIKKNFNKRAYLKDKLKTNFGSQQEGHGRAYLQKKAVVRQYFRQQRREEEKHRKKLQFQQSPILTNSNKIDKFGNLDLESVSDTLTEEITDAGQPVSSQEFPKKRLNSWQRARAEYHKKISEIEKIKEESATRKKEIEEAKRKHKEKRLQRYKKLNQKTKKGQPVMSSRIELMLEQLQGEVGYS
nr:thyroid transcription factor 1-associated protein 26-like [Procambarus clarkii]